MGFGDICAYNLSETVFVIVFAYMALLIVQVSIANLLLFFSGENASKVTFIEKELYFQKFAKRHAIPEDIKVNA